jgi:hypothetical protein
VAVRISPTPERSVHVGLCRMALLNALLASKFDLDIVLRFDDLAPDCDGESTEAGAVAQAFRWLELPRMESPWTPGDRGPYLQSQRIELYREAARSLLDCGAAYACRCARPSTTRGCTCSQSVRRGSKELIQDAAVRFLYTSNDDVRLHDLVRGELRIPARALGNPVLLKRSGLPSFYLSYAVDDFLMGIKVAVFERSPIPTAYVRILSQVLFGTYREVLHIGRLRGSRGRDLKTMTVRGHPVAYLDAFANAGMSPHTVRALLIRSLLKGGKEQLSLVPSIGAIAERMSLADLKCNDAVLPVEELGAIQRAIARRAWA